MSTVDQMGGLGTCTNNQYSSTNISQTPKKMHLSSLSSVLIQGLLSRPYSAEVLLQLEMNREPLNLQASCRPDFQNSLSYIRAYFKKLNSIYPCLSSSTWSSYYDTALSQGFCKGPESCIVLLVIALGHTANIVESLHPPESDPPGLPYFVAAWNLLPKIMLRNNLVATQSQVLSALYLMQIFRHVEAWNVLTSASLKFQLLVRKSSTFSEVEEELGSRLYWSTAMMEDDLSTELDLPPTGLLRLEVRFPLPVSLKYLQSSTAIRDELHYFLVDITLRRIHDRVNAMLSAWDSQCSIGSIESSIIRLNTMIHELDRQLNIWYTELPPAFQFPLHEVTSLRSAQTMLRLRYFACRAAIFQPYVLLALRSESFMDSNWQDRCHKCLEACVRQLEHLTAHQNGDFSYFFQKLFSIASAVLLVMGASMNPALAQLLPPMELTDDIIDNAVLGLERKAHLAPSICLSAKVIREAESKRRMWLNRLF